MDKPGSWPLSAGSGGFPSCSRHPCSVKSNLLSDLVLVCRLLFTWWIEGFMKSIFSKFALPVFGICAALLLMDPSMAFAQRGGGGGRAYSGRSQGYGGRSSSGGGQSYASRG